MTGKQNLILFIGLLLIFLNLWWGGQWSVIWSVISNNIPAAGSTSPNYNYGAGTGQSNNKGSSGSESAPGQSNAPGVTPIQPIGPLPFGMAL